MQQIDGTVILSVDKYDELVESRKLLENVYSFITREHMESIKKDTNKSTYVSTKELEIASGYVENEDYFDLVIKNLKNDLMNGLEK